MMIGIRHKGMNYALRRVLRPIFAYTRDVWLWKAGLRTGPPAFIKQRHVKNFQKAFDIPVFVETGTYLGEMVNAVKNRFAEIYSIELDEHLVAKARRRFRKHKHVHIIRGDSSEVLPGLLRSLSARKLIWLDAHFSGGITARGSVTTPIVRELAAVRASYRPGDVLLIDDFSSFTGTDDYPDVGALKAIIKEVDSSLQVHIVDDVVCVYDPHFSRARG